MNLLEVRELVKTFDGVPVLSSISFSLPEGTILGLVGENGAGKSTLVKCIAGIHRRDAGTISLHGTCYTIPQEFTLIPELTVWENLFLGRELTCGIFLRKKEMR